MVYVKNPIIRFYLLPTKAQPIERLNFTCQLVEKAYQTGLKTVVICPDDGAATELDQKLWTFKRESFIAHCLLSEKMAEHAPVIISTPAERIKSAAVQIDLSFELKPDIPRGCGRILEVILQENKEVLRSTRARFAFYKDRGFQPQLHKL